MLREAEAVKQGFRVCEKYASEDQLPAHLPSSPVQRDAVG